MYYVYILFSRKINKLYTGLTDDLRKRLDEHNRGLSIATKFGKPWELEFYAAFQSKSKAVEFEQYLKTGSGKAFKYKRFLPEALKKDGELVK